MKITIAGLNKTDLLMALYKAANFQGENFQNHKIAPCPDFPPEARKEAEKLINECLSKNKCYFDYIDLGLGPRLIKMDLSGHEVDTTSYDKAHGSNAGQTVIQKLEIELLNNLSLTKKYEESQNLSEEIPFKRELTAENAEKILESNITFTKNNNNVIDNTIYPLSTVNQSLTQNFTTFSINPFHVEALEKITNAIFQGVQAGIINLVQTVLHPIDEVLIPVSDLLLDCVIVVANNLSSAHVNSTDFFHNVDIDYLKNLIMENPKVYNDAIYRMQKRWQDLKSTGEYLLVAPMPEKIKILTEMATTIYVPGKVFTAAETILKNVKAFKMVLPPQYHSSGADPWMTKLQVKTLSPSDIRKLEYDDLMYVINSDRELIITQQNYDHWHLGNDRPVFGAGDIKVQHGQITYIDTRSGSYGPYGEHLKELIEGSFIQHGYPEAKGIFVDYNKKMTDFYKNHSQPRSYIRELPMTSRIGSPNKLAMTMGLINVAAKKLNDVSSDFSNNQEINKLSAIHTTPSIFLAHDEQAKKHLSEKQYVLAIDSYDKALAHDPSHALFYHERGFCHYQLENYEKTISDCEEATRLDPKLSNAFHTMGTAYYQLKKYDKAIEHFNKAINLNPNFADTYNERGKAHEALIHYLEARDDFAKALKLNHGPDDTHIERINKAIIKVKTDFLMDLGKKSCSEKKYSNAIEQFDEVIKLDPNIELTYHARGYCYYKLGNYEKAITECDLAIHLDANESLTYHNRGKAYYQLKNYKAAIENLNQSINLNPNDVTSYEIRAFAHEALGDYFNAKNDLEKALAFNSEIANDHLARINKAIIKVKTDFLMDLGKKSCSEKKYSNAIEQFDEVIKFGNYKNSIDSGKILGKNKHFQTLALCKLAKLYFDQKNYDKAIQHYSEALNYSSTNKIIYKNLAFVYSAQNNHELALENFNKAMALDPNLSDGYFLRGKAYLSLRKFSAAINDFTQYIRLNSGGKISNAELSNTYYHRALSYYKLSKYNESTDDYHQALALKSKPKDKAMIYKKLMLSYLANGDTSKATDAFQNALLLDPTIDPNLLKKAEEGLKIEMAFKWFREISKSSNSNVLIDISDKLPRPASEDTNKAHQASSTPMINSNINLRTSYSQSQPHEKRDIGNHGNLHRTPKGTEGLICNYARTCISSPQSTTQHCSRDLYCAAPGASHASLFSNRSEWDRNQRDRQSSSNSKSSISRDTTSRGPGFGSKGDKYNERHSSGLNRKNR